MLRNRNLRWTSKQTSWISKQVFLWTSKQALPSTSTQALSWTSKALPWTSTEAQHWCHWYMRLISQILFPRHRFPPLLAHMMSASPYSIWHLHSWPDSSDSWSEWVDVGHWFACHDMRPISSRLDCSLGRYHCRTNCIHTDWLTSALPEVFMYDGGYSQLWFLCPI